LNGATGMSGVLALPQALFGAVGACWCFWAEPSWTEPIGAVACTFKCDLITIGL
jgi:hypothetical protein